MYFVSSNKQIVSHYKRMINRNNSFVTSTLYSYTYTKHLYTYTNVLYTVTKDSEMSPNNDLLLLLLFFTKLIIRLCLQTFSYFSLSFVTVYECFVTVYKSLVTLYKTFVHSNHLYKTKHYSQVCRCFSAKYANLILIKTFIL